MSFPRSALAVVGALSFLTSCAYYNTMYNANRRFSDAEKALARGDRAAAQAAFRESIEKATASVTRHPNSRWRDDARLLMARAHLQLGEAHSAAGNLRDLLDDSAVDEKSRAAAQIYLAAVSAELNEADAIEQLNGALAGEHAPAEVRAEGHLARARLHQRAGNFESSFADTRVARTQGSESVRLAAVLLDLRSALAARDSTRAALELNALLRDEKAQRWTDSLRVLTRLAATQFSAEWAGRSLGALEQAPWRASARDSLLLERAGLTLQSGDTAAALSSAQRIAARATGTMADQARVRAAEWNLARVTELAQLADVRADLLPAIGNERARALLHSLKIVDVLAEKARLNAQPLALFAAAELARDDLRAHALAAQLFATYAELAPATVWTPKALLAAGDLAPARAADFRARAETQADNPYVAVVNGRGDDEAFRSAEERLARAQQAILSDAELTAAQRDASVSRAVAVIDSLRLAARSDSTRLSCGIMVDTLAVIGIRADSIRAACQRGDAPRIGILLTADTLMLRDSTKARADSLNRTQRVRRDTIETS